MDVFVDYAYRKDALESALAIEKLVTFLLEQCNLPDTTEVSISFVTNDEIKRLNEEYRGIQRPTDVLSFECDGVDDNFAVPDQEKYVYELGDIVIAPDVAEQQSREYGLSFGDELSLLITHGILHLCGYDHIREDEALQMEARERELLSMYYNRSFRRSAAETIQES